MLSSVQAFFVGCGVILRKGGLLLSLKALRDKNSPREKPLAPLRASPYCQIYQFVKACRFEAQSWKCFANALSKPAKST